MSKARGFIALYLVPTGLGACVAEVIVSGSRRRADNLAARVRFEGSSKLISAALVGSVEVSRYDFRCQRPLPAV